jgi:FAD/FMN-containing dehydrogenase
MKYAGELTDLFFFSPQKAVPMSRLPDIIQQTKDDISQAGLLSGMVGHVGDGNFHCELPTANVLTDGLVRRLTL